MKKVFKILKSLSANLTWKMIKALLSKPLLLLPTAWATIESILFSEINFHESHGGRGAANAFRHAAWNLLIAKNCTVFTSKRKAIIWAKYVTDLHEECFPNEPFDNQMDLHNNKIGRDVFLDLMNQNIQSKKKMIQFLVEKTDFAVGLTDEKLMVDYPEDLVYFQE